jgi:mRNA interferase MazF
MKVFQQGQIWLVNFDPSFGHEYQKIRPALIIQHERYIPSTQLLTVIPISSQIEKVTELDIWLEKNTQNKLMKNSLIKTKQINSFDKKRFIKLIGTVNQQILDEVNKNIRLFFGIEE